jgi:hypothetical protein
VTCQLCGRSDQLHEFKGSADEPPRAALAKPIFTPIPLEVAA